MAISNTKHTSHNKAVTALIHMIEGLTQTNQIQNQQKPAAKEAAPAGNSQHTKKKISANKAVIPVIIVLAILHIIIIVLIMLISKSSNVLAVNQRNAGLYSSEASSIINNTMQLSETASAYILMPLTGNGEINYHPLETYSSAFFSDNRSGKVLERFQNYDVSDQVRGLLAEASAKAEFMVASQLHAISLMNSIYPLPGIESINLLPLAELTDDEKNMPDEQKLLLAESLVFGSDYTSSRGMVNAKVTQAVGMIQGVSQTKIAEMAQLVSKLRTIMWWTTFSIMVILTLTFVMLFRWILNPLGEFTEKIPTGDLLDEEKGFKEVTVLATAYNDVLKRRNALDAILRSAAETDALTNLQNRYSFEQYILELENNSSSMAVFLFDVNYLKKTNDTLGHLAGDQLICVAAKCISENFGEKCYRFGGDEFAAIVENCTHSSLQEMIRNFLKADKENNVSISYGYAYTPDLSRTNFKNLLDEADRNMYAQKRETHKEHSPE